ncbi:Hypothetical predicted protein [Pelobates cultripes]|uniref:Uncharacterized protein n=1 Tax=Pelobates cultripes TaxID=61616 RepID=A0AAD1SIF3_PELCU|nr:Hypothetical predicted protein [Pelobates cultripes]
MPNNVAPSTRSQKYQIITRSRVLIGRIKKAVTPHPSWHPISAARSRPIDNYQSSPAALTDAAGPRYMASRHMEMTLSQKPRSPGNLEADEGDSPSTIELIRRDLWAISSFMFKKTDADANEASLKHTIWASVLPSAKMSRHSRNRSRNWNLPPNAPTSNMVLLKWWLQGRRQVEDLDNRSRQGNIRIHGLPEDTLTEPLESALQALFNSILGNDTKSIQLDRAHRVFCKQRQIENAETWFAQSTPSVKMSG